MNSDKLEKLRGKKIILFTMNGFRFQGSVKDVDDTFIEIFDDIKHVMKMINIKEIAEIEVKDA